MCRCRAFCVDHVNGTHPEGSTWHPNSCTSCTCDTGGKLNCKETVCSIACNDPLPAKPGTCCPICPIAVSVPVSFHLERIEEKSVLRNFFILCSFYFQPTKGNGVTNGGHHQGKGWGTVPIILITILSLFCLMLIVHILHSRFRARLSPSETSYSIYPPQYYKCVPVYDTPVHRNEKIVPL